MSAIDHYHSLLTDDIAGETQHQLDEQLRRRGLYFGDRPLCTVLRPRLLAPDEYRLLQAQGALILRAFRAAHRAALADDAVLDQFRLFDWERSLVRLDPGFGAASPVSRLDAFVEEGGLRFTEYNAETPAGGGYNDVLTELFFGLRVVAEFAREWDLRPLPARPHVLQVLLDAYRQWSGTSAAPRVAILDWAEVPTYSEFLLFQRYFEEQGISCAIVDPREVEYTGGRLIGDAGPIDLIYKRVLLSELVERGGIDHPVLRAVRDRKVCMVNPPSCKILHKKASLAVLTDERNAHLFDAEARQAIARHVPWTRVVEERKTTHPSSGDAMIDLVPSIVDRRERLVLKPNDEYGGKGIVLGWEVSQTEWDAAVRTALAEPYIVQERITLPVEPYPSLVDGRVQFIDRMVDTAPYVAHGQYVEGCLSRLSTAALLNVTAGGGSQVPSFVVEPRS